MAWIESHQSLRDHRKTKRMARRLGIPRIYVVGHLHGVWWWALDNAPKGFVSEDDRPSIAEAAEWEGDPDVFVETMIYAEFAERTEGGVIIHDWDEYAGKLLEQRQANADRQRRYRERRRDGDVTHDNEERNALRDADITVTSPLRNGATGPNPTGPNSTKERTAAIDTHLQSIDSNGKQPLSAATAPRALSPKAKKLKEPAPSGFGDMWVAFANELNGKPTTPGEQKKWADAIKELLKANVAVESVPRLVARYRLRFGDIVCNPRGISNNLTELSDDAAKRSQAQEPVYLTPEDHDERIRKELEWAATHTIPPNYQRTKMNGSSSHPASSTSSRTSPSNSESA